MKINIPPSLYCIAKNNKISIYNTLGIRANESCFEYEFEINFICRIVNVTSIKLHCHCYLIRGCHILFYVTVYIEGYKKRDRNLMTATFTVKRPYECVRQFFHPSMAILQSNFFMHAIKTLF